MLLVRIHYFLSCCFESDGVQRGYVPVTADVPLNRSQLSVLLCFSVFGTEYF